MEFEAPALEVLTLTSDVIVPSNVTDITPFSNADEDLLGIVKLK